MNQILLYTSFLIVSVYANGQLSVLHHPTSLHFKGHERLKESILKEIYSAALGFTIEQYSDWEGLFIDDPFNLAEAIVTVAVDGVSETNPAKAHHFPLKTDEDESNIFNSLERRITERYPESGSQIVRVELSEGLENIHNYDIFQGIKDNKLKKKTLNHLKNSIDEDREFLKEINLLNSITDNIEEGVVKQDYTPDIFWFKVSGLHAISDLYGENSTQATEAKQLLSDTIIRMNNAFKKAYNGNVLVTVISSDAAHTRRSRSILQTKSDDTDSFDKLNLAKSYSKDYPAIFNIILWFGVAMVFSLLAICLAIGNMDPGRDSIIYRMTSTRMKKDN